MFLDVWSFWTFDVFGRLMFLDVWGFLTLEVFGRLTFLGGLGGSGAPLISPPNGHFIGGPESVKILGVRGILAVLDKIKPNGDGRTYGRTYVRTYVRTDEIWKAWARPAPLGSGKYLKTTPKLPPMFLTLVWKFQQQQKIPKSVIEIMCFWLTGGMLDEWLWNCFSWHIWWSDSV